MPPANDNYITPSSRKRIEDQIERLIARLDAADPDADLEDDDRERDPSDDEHSLGWTGDIDQERAHRHYRRCEQFGHLEAETR